MGVLLVSERVYNVQKDADNVPYLAFGVVLDGRVWRLGFMFLDFSSVLELIFEGFAVVLESHVMPVEGGEHLAFFCDLVEGEGGEVLVFQLSAGLDESVEPVRVLDCVGPSLFEQDLLMRVVLVVVDGNLAETLVVDVAAELVLGLDVFLQLGVAELVG